MAITNRNLNLPAERTYQEVADIMGITKQEAYVIERRAMRRLRRILLRRLGSDVLREMTNYD